MTAKPLAKWLKSKSPTGYVQWELCYTHAPVRVAHITYLRARPHYHYSINASGFCTWGVVGSVIRAKRIVESELNRHLWNTPEIINA